MGRKGKIFVVGIGPGDRTQMTLASLDAIRRADVVTGYKTYIELIEDLLKGKIVEKSGMGKEVERCEKALRYAEEGHIVSLISSGDPGVYGMAGLMLEIMQNEESDMEVEVVPGVTAAHAAAASLGAPFMHDYVVISLSDLLTEWSLIEKRLHCAGEGDFVLCLYNPRSSGRERQIEIARDILLKYKKDATPCGIVRNAKRGDEEVIITTLGKLLEYNIDMFTVVIIGNSSTFTAEGKMITPRGYEI